MKLKDLDADRIHRAFSPAKEISDPKLFAGRKAEIRSGINALLNRGGFLAVFGLRGVGKSSVALQLKAIAEGNTELPRMLALHRLLPRKGFNFIVQYYKSDGFVKNTGDLFKRVLFGDDANPSLFDLTKSGDKKLEQFKRTVKAEGSLGAFGARIGAGGSEESTYSRYVSDDLIQQFRTLLGTIHKDNQERTGLLILIDEFDTIADKEGFASIVKACSSDFVRFGVVGIATSVAELMRDHSSIGRQIDSVRIPHMPETELGEILRKGEFVVDQAITFSSGASAAITSRSEGFPFFTHLLGKEAMLLAFERNSTRVTDEDIELLSKHISEGRLSCIYEDMYHDAVKNSPQRELLLKIFAEHREDEINTEDVYSLAKSMDISNPSQLMKQLTSPDNQHLTPVLVKLRDRYFRFSDPVFKTYSRLRSWKFNG
jgi:energy-coupling factor transporter ATP-binding protein EcfA2